MASRKRPFAEDDEAAAAKKRVLTGPNGSPLVNGLAGEHDEPTEGDNLELYRKEAIFRRMRHYSREHERSQSRIAELERRKQTCEAGLAAMAACWNQLVKTIRLLVRAEDLPQVADEMFDFTVRMQDNEKPDFAKTLEVNMNATQTLVTKLVKAGGDTQIHLPNGSTFPECQKATAECIALQSQLDVISAKLQDSERQKEEYHEALLAAENRLDRFRSKTVLAVPSPVERKQEPREEVIEESQRKPSSPEGSHSPAHANGICDPTELDVLREQLMTREARIIELEREVAANRDQKALLESELKLMSHDKITENPHFKMLQNHAGFMQATAEENKAQASRLLEELNQLRASRKEWEDAVIGAANQANQELNAMLAKRDSENARLREQREQQGAELNERKAQESIKVASLRELKALADSRSERIAALESEVSRCKAQLAAHAGDEELMTFFMSGNTEDAAYYQSLRDRAAAADERVAALEETLSKYQGDHPDVAEHMKAEANALEKLAEAQSQLEKYKAVYGDPSSLPPDVSTLAEQLRHKEEEIQKLRVAEIQRTQAETSLYAELDKLSAAWESLDRQVEDKVFGLSGLESQLKKSASEKAKSDNKFFAAMRDKDAVELENSKLRKELDKQNKVVEKLVETERNLAAQLSTFEKELSAAKTVCKVYKDRADHLAHETNQWSCRLDAEKKIVANIREAFNGLEKANALRAVDLRKLEDGLIRTRKELEIKQRQTPAMQTDDIDMSELMSLLKCSTCRERFRKVAITKCMHTFCRECVEARIATRQRKCPACNLAFAQSDVLTLYFQ
ncbi:putative BRE1 E3 ubiquitin ligase [Lyophyllum shimeji]|uniref:E3 ubiquitin protein ligase n=1 Tax=Lyophyllum shimeji TaxID=47721 RepID=A0A9P3PKI6_LYOSH|nr:putative BRE1 E3 ubiquitin ligase [Lyophyllum shimeji]